MDDNIDFLEPWEESDSDGLLEELKREISDGHILKGIKLEVIARRIDRDDVLYRFVDDPNKYAQVHLTWNREYDSNWPATKIFNSLEEWKNKIMIPDNKLY